MPDINDLMKQMEPNERATVRTFLRIRDALGTRPRSEYDTGDTVHLDAVAAALTNAVALLSVEDAITRLNPV